MKLFKIIILEMLREYCFFLVWCRWEKFLIINLFKLLLFYVKLGILRCWVLIFVVKVLMNLEKYSLMIFFFNYFGRYEYYYFIWFEMLIWNIIESGLF